MTEFEFAKDVRILHTSVLLPVLVEEPQRVQAVAQGLHSL